MTKKTLFKALGLLAIALVVGVVAVLKSIDFNQYKGMISAMVKDATGRELTIDGDLSLAIGFSPAVVVEGVRLSNAAWGSGPDMVSVKRFEAEVALLPLLSGGVQVKRLFLVEPDILLETDKSGAGNWVFTPAKTASGTPVEPTAPAEASAEGTSVPALDISEVSIRQAKLTHKDGQTGKTTTVVVDSLTATADDPGSPIVLELKAALNDQPIEVSGTIGALSALLAGETFPVDLTVTAMGMTASAKGSMSNALAVPEADLTVAVKAGASDLAGTIKAVIGEVPTISADLASSHLNPADFSPSSSEPAPAGEGSTAPTPQASSAGARGKKVFPADALPLEALHAANVNAKIKVAELISGDMTVKNLDLTLSLKGGRLMVSPLSAALGGGTIGGTVGLDASSKTLANLDADLTVSHLNVGTLLQEMNVTSDIVGAPTDVTVKLTGSGKSIAGIMATSNGRILSTVGEGKINNKAIKSLTGDVLSQLNPFADQREFTMLQCAVVNFPVRNGLIETENGIGVETDVVTIQGGGTINLATEALDVHIGPQARQGIGLSAGSLTSAVKLGGTLAEPTPTIDAMGAAKTGLKVGRALATGGLSLLADALVDKATADTTPCATALGQKAPAPAQQQPTETQPQPQPANNPNPVDALKGLFGR